MRTLPILILAVAFSGCTSFELARLRNDIARHNPEAEIADGYTMSFGRVSIGLARWLSGLADDDDNQIAQAVLSEVRRVQFGRFEVEGSFDASTMSMPRRLYHYLNREDWHHLVTVRDESEAVWVVYKEKDETVVDMLAVVMDAEELVLAKISGNLNGVVMAALAQQGIGTSFFGDEEESADHYEGDSDVVEAISELYP